MLTKTPLEFEQRRALLERAAASLVHAIAGPLNVVSGRAALMALKSGDSEVVRTAELIQSQVQKLTACLEQVRAFAERPSAKLVDVSLSGVASSAIDHAVAVVAPREVRFELSASEDVCRLPFEPFALSLSNMFTYAAKRAQPGTPIAVQLSAEPAKRSEHAPHSATVRARARFVPDSDPLPLSSASRCEPWFTSAEGEAHEVDTGLLLAASCGSAHDQGGWSVASVTDGVFELAMFWPLAETV